MSDKFKAMTSRDVEHANSQGKGLARQSMCAKRAWGPASIHPGFANLTSTTLGAPPTGAPPDASSPSPLDPTRTKTYPIPAASWDMKGGDGQRVDKSAAHCVMGQARSANFPDFAKSLHTVLPGTTSEET